MNSHIYSQKKLNKAMSNEQFEQVVAAISDGRYSWACVLILRFAGYNPLHFIPHRTYSRLIKENSPVQPVNVSNIETKEFSNNKI